MFKIETGSPPLATKKFRDLKAGEVGVFVDGPYAGDHVVVSAWNDGAILYGFVLERNLFYSVNVGGEPALLDNHVRRLGPGDKVTIEVVG